MGSMLNNDVLLTKRGVIQIPRSHQRIFTALYELSREKAYDKILVKEICERASLSKSTFYQHFEDKNDILRWHWGLITSQGIDQIGRTLTWEEGHFITSAGIALAIDLYRSAIQSSDKYHGIGLYHVRTREAVLKETIVEYRHIALTELLDIQICALAAGEQAVMMRWFEKERSNQEIEAYVKMLVSIVPRELYETLELKPSNDRLSHANPWDFLIQ